MSEPTNPRASGVVDAQAATQAGERKVGAPKQFLAGPGPIVERQGPCADGRRRCHARAIQQENATRSLIAR